jgi:integrase
MGTRVLTAAYIQKVRPPAKGAPQIDVFDKGYPGLFLRVPFGGTKAFVHAYRHGDRQYRRKLGLWPVMTLAEARDAWRRDRALLAAGLDPQAPTVAEERQSFAAAAEEWLKRDQTGRSQDEVKRILIKDVLPRWRSVPIDQISRRDVIELLDVIEDRGSPIMARRVHSHLHRLFKWSVGRGVIAANPMAELPKPGSENIRTRKLTDQELAQVWHAAADLKYPFGPMYQLLILTGARLAEISDLRWTEIKDDVIELAGDRTKNNQEHSIPLSDAAASIVAALPRFCPYVFSTNRKRPVSGFSKAKAVLDKAAPIPAWRTHDLRRSMASGMQRLGVQERVIEAALGHSSASRNGLLRVYQQHDFSLEKREALSLWSKHVMKVVADKDGRRRLA